VAEIVITEFMDEGAVEALRERCEVHYDPDLAGRPDDIAALLGDARALIVRNRTRVGPALLDAAPRLRAVGRLGVGLDNIDLAACAAREIEVLPAVGANATAVAEYVVTAVLVLLRGVYTSSGRVVAGEWPRTELVGREAFGKTLGLVGLGTIGREVASRAVGLGMRIAATDPFLDPGDPAWTGIVRLDLPDLLAQSDAVSLHVPLTDGTRHLVDAAAIAGMRPGAVLVNTARGGIVDEEALAAALRDGRLGGAALDVFEAEPVAATAAGHFADVPNLILTPHVAGITTESNTRVSNLTADNVLRALGA
jgi:(S)-sulfolactate dehydrogenase